jgi:hypothetical protein
VRVLAPLPGARFAWVARRRGALAAARSKRSLAVLESDADGDEAGLDYFDPVPVLGTGAALPVEGTGGGLEFGVAGVIGEGGRRIRTEDAPRHVAGLCVAVLARRLTEASPALALGPWLATTDELERRAAAESDSAHDGAITVSVDGELRYRGSMAHPIAVVGRAVAAASTGAALSSGDVVCASVGGLVAPGAVSAAGSDVAVYIERIGVLRLRAAPVRTKPIATEG